MASKKNLSSNASVWTKSEKLRAIRRYFSTSERPVSKDELKTFVASLKNGEFDRVAADCIAALSSKEKGFVVVPQA